MTVNQEAKNNIGHGEDPRLKEKLRKRIENDKKRLGRIC